MKVSNKTKNVRQRFFRSTRRLLGGVFGDPTDPRGYPGLPGPVFVAPSPIYDAPSPRQQGVKGKQK